MALGGGIVLAVLLSASAWSFWTSAGSGVGSAGTGALTPATDVSGAVAPGAPVVTVSWSASADAPARIDGYFVQRLSSGSPAPACGTSPTTLLAAGATGCTDVPVTNGSLHLHRHGRPRLLDGREHGRE